MPKVVFQGTFWDAEWGDVYRRVVAPLRRVAKSPFRLHLRIEAEVPDAQATLRYLKADASALGLRGAVSVVDSLHQPLE